MMQRVLVIDDEKMVRDLIAQALTRLDFSVDTADNALNGMAQYDRCIYDLVITDVRMPGVDGHTVANHIRHSNRDATPVIGVSGTPALLKGGVFDDVLYKPFRLQALIEKVTILTRTRVADHADVA
ncbi:MAG: response regulator [Desulfatitalea sp.]|nr:response regulator [Desulfatitalea sp.]